MKLVLILFGISLEINRYWQYGALYSVDYNNRYDNYQRYIFDYFKGKGYSIDVYISTNKLNSENDIAEIIDKYKDRLTEEEIVSGIVTFDAWNARSLAKYNPKELAPPTV